MKFTEKFKKLPEIYKRQGKECYLDPIRKKLIYVTPEETVRQRVIQFLIENGVPKDMISVEEHLSHYGIKSKARADIIINGYLKAEKVKNPIAIIECKSPNTLMDLKTFNQAADYADAIDADYIMLTNGIDCVYFHYNDDIKDYDVITELPTYDDMLKGKYDLIEKGEIPERIPFDKLESKGIQEYLNYNIGADTPKPLQIAMVNLKECLMDFDFVFPEKNYRLFKVVKDIGLRLMTYGNVSGGTFNGVYRSFIINYKGNTEIVSIGISTYFTWAKQDIEKTVINIAIDNEKTSHLALQLSVDDNVKIMNDTVKFFHHGKIAVGNMGSGKLDELREFVRKYYPKIIFNNQYFLGELPNNRLWNISDDDIVELIENLISYALIRDEYRAFLKSRSRKSKKK